MREYQKIVLGSDYIQERISLKPKVGIILGSGLGELGDEVEQPTVIPYHEIPHLPKATVPGHKGQFVIGQLAGVDVCLMQGRYHHYEGYEPEELVRPLRIMKLLGISTIIITNATGGVNRNYNVGDLVLLTDYINNMGINPLRGENIEELGLRFPDVTFPFDQTLITLAEKVGKNIDLGIRKGVYIAFGGPCYESAAEIRMSAILGADVVGMSTVPEVIAAKHMGLKVLGISCVTNMAAGILPDPLTHEDVMTIALAVREPFKKFIKDILREGALNGVL